MMVCTFGKTLSKSSRYSVSYTHLVGEAMLGGIDNEDNMAALQKLIDQALANDSAK